MRLTLTSRDDGPRRYLDLDHEREVVRLLGAQEELLGSVTWETLITLICASAAELAGREKRSSARAPVALRVAYGTRHHDEGVSVTRDIGAGGLFIETARPFPAGTELSVSFVLPDPPFERISAKARVAWVRHTAERCLLLPGMGLQFVDIDPLARRAIQELVRMLNESRGTTDEPGPPT